MYKSKSKSIIAMKGYPFTRKTEVARIIATSVGCPVLSFDNLLDLIPPNPPSNTQPQDLAFNMICQMVESNLREGFIKDIVIDSPLSSRSHLDQLVELVKPLHKTRLIIVECKTDNIYKWQTLFEEYHLDRNPARKWQDVVKAIRNGYDDEVYYKLPKFVVDPLSLYSGSDAPDANESSPLAPLIYAMRYMIQRPVGSGSRVVVYDLWRQGHYHTSGGDESTNESCRVGAHDVIDTIDATVKCRACEGQLAAGEAAYKCRDCSFAFHKQCHGLLDISNGTSSAISCNDLNHALTEGVHAHDIDDTRCSRCEKKKDESSEPCKTCVVAKLMKAHRMPSLIRHDCHHHILAAETSDRNPYGEYCNCKACGVQLGECVWYSCKVCRINYHYGCLTEFPVRARRAPSSHAVAVLL